MKALMITLGAISAIAASAVTLAFVGLPYQPLGVEFLQNNPYEPATITAEATGSAEPTEVEDAEFGDVMVNGDFRILETSEFGTLGDGEDELTLWDFDFRDDTNFEDFPTSAPLASAQLTMTLTPRSEEFRTDWVSVNALDDIFPEEYDEFPLDTESTIELELLDFYTSEEVLEALTTGDGRIAMVAGDDSVISEAELVLVSEPALN